MAKTVFAHGTIVTPEFLNTHYVLPHKHDGSVGENDVDGHCDQIDLASEVTGQLPAANIGGHTHTLANISSITMVTFPIDISQVGLVGVTAIIQSFLPSLKLVTLLWPAGNVSNSASPNALTSVGEVYDAIPVELNIRPVDHLYLPVVLISNSNKAPGALHISPDGTVEFFRYYQPLDSNSMQMIPYFILNEEAGWYSFTVTYSVQTV